MTTSDLLSIVSIIAPFQRKFRGRKSAFLSQIEKIKFLRYGPRYSFAEIARVIKRENGIARSYGAMLNFKNKQNIR